MADEVSLAILVLPVLWALLAHPEKLDLKDCQEDRVVVVKQDHEENEAKLVHLDLPEALA